MSRLITLLSGRRRLLGLGLVLSLMFGTTACIPGLGGGTMTITALMPDSAGLFVGNDVGILGVPVGKVQSIKPEGTHVRVVLTVDKNQAIPAGAGAVVVARSVATDRYVELTPVYHSGARMQDGAVIQESLTRTPVDFDQVLAALNTFATGIAGSGATKDAIKNILKSGSTAIAGRGSEFNNAITSLGSAVNTISGQRGNITSTVKSLDTLTTTIAQNQQLVRSFITQVSQASSLLADERLNFQSALRSLSNAVQLVAVFAHANRQQVVSTLGQSTTVMKNLMTRRGQLVETLRTMPLALQNLRAILNGDRLMVRVDPTVLLPIGGILDTLCKSAPGDACAAIGPSLLNLTNLLALLGLA